MPATALIAVVFIAFLVLAVIVYKAVDDNKRVAVVSLVMVTLLIGVGLGYSFRGNVASDTITASIARSASTPTPKPTRKATATPNNKKNTSASVTKAPEVRSYVLNKSTKVFHFPSCAAVRQMKSSNRLDYRGTRQSVINMGYKSCGRCNP